METPIQRLIRHLKITTLYPKVEDDLKELERILNNCSDPKCECQCHN